MTASTFYRLLADPTTASRWHLRALVDPEGREVGARSFTKGLVARELPDLTIPLRREGDEVDFNFGDFDMIVTPATINSELNELMGNKLQRIPVRVRGCGRQFEILNALDLVECIDEVASETMKWTQADGRLDKVGKYRMITRLRINPAAAQGHHFFRIVGWPIALIASEQVRRLLMAHEISGVKYEAVS